jgi:hypothetical protein
MPAKQRSRAILAIIELIQVHPEQGEFWDKGGLNKIQFLFQAVKAIATGTTPDVNEGEQHGSVGLPSNVV